MGLVRKPRHDRRHVIAVRPGSRALDSLAILLTQVIFEPDLSTLHLGLPSSTFLAPFPSLFSGSYTTLREL